MRDALAHQLAMHRRIPLSSGGLIPRAMGGTGNGVVHVCLPSSLVGVKFAEGSLSSPALQRTLGASCPLAPPWERSVPGFAQAHMIISGGVNIYPQEAENVLIEHPAIADGAVIGRPHPEFGEEVKAVVEPACPVDNPAALAAEIIAFCRARLSAIKCPRSVDFVSELPRNDAGKLVKHVLKRRYWAGRESVII